jgi:hypothetical protein
MIVSRSSFSGAAGLSTGWNVLVVRKALLVFESSGGLGLGLSFFSVSGVLMGVNRSLIC